MAQSIGMSLHAFTGGVIRPSRVRRILEAAGHEIRFGWPGPGGRVAVWGRSAPARRGEWVAARSGAALVRIEDAFIRSVKPGYFGDPTIGLMIDPQGGVHFDATGPSALEQLLATHPLDAAGLEQRARDGIARLIEADLSKYNAHDPGLAAPDPGYVLVIDQVRGDAGIRYGGADERSFRQMLNAALDENPGARVVIKTHPETAAGQRLGHYGRGSVGGRVSLLEDPVSPWALLKGARRVYTVSSQLGFEAILAGHRPRVFGQPFYAGWGLTEDAQRIPRRGRALSCTQLFAGAMLLAPTWYDPCRDRICDFETAIDHMEAEARAFREDRFGHVAVGVRMWKRGPLQRIFGGTRKLRFADRSAQAVEHARAEGRDIAVWASKEPRGLAADAARAGVRLRRVEDGFLRSKGLGAELTPALSLVSDDLGIYYDPRRESRLERLIIDPAPPGAEARAARLMQALVEAGLSKYNTGDAALPQLPAGRRILVPGQVEDDASLRTGGGTVRRNLELLRRTRADNPDAVILYKPHPDVEAGLRDGDVAHAAALEHADMILERIDPAALLTQVDEVWTMTSAMGFEALIRGRAVTCLGAPFYAGWGLTRDLGPVPHRRRAVRPSLAKLVHAALIAYPRYFDPVSGRPCTPEVVAERLAAGAVPAEGRLNRGLARLQGVFASHAHLWR